MRTLIPNPDYNQLKAVWENNKYNVIVQLATGEEYYVKGFVATPDTFIIHTVFPFNTAKDGALKDSNNLPISINVDTSKDLFYLEN
jgi:hypothetical protein